MRSKLELDYLELPICSKVGVSTSQPVPETAAICLSAPRVAASFPVFLVVLTVQAFVLAAQSFSLELLLAVHVSVAPTVSS